MKGREEIKKAAKWNFRRAAAVALAAALLLSGYMDGLKSRAEAGNKEYGVFPGLDSGGMETLKEYRTVIIDGAYFTLEDIKKLHNHGQEVYSYLNAGSLEAFRSYGGKFKKLILGEYENWPDERWMNVSSPLWQKHVTDVQAGELVQKKIDGFFLDNLDVYYVYPKEEIYQGLLSIVRKLAAYELPIIINGGDVWVKEAIGRGDLKKGMIRGVNQECVFTSIDFDRDTLGIQGEETTNYYKDYLNLCRKQGYSIYLTEYTDVSQTRDRIQKYCDKKGYLVFFADSPELNHAFER